jgi:uncharacterized membrane protein YkvI
MSRVGDKRLSTAFEVCQQVNTSRYVDFLQKIFRQALARRLDILLVLKQFNVTVQTFKNT